MDQVFLVISSRKYAISILQRIMKNWTIAVTSIWYRFVSKMQIYSRRVFQISGPMQWCESLRGQVSNSLPNWKIISFIRHSTHVLKMPVTVAFIKPHNRVSSTWSTETRIFVKGGAAVCAPNPFLSTTNSKIMYLCDPDVTVMVVQ